MFGDLALESFAYVYRNIKISDIIISKSLKHLWESISVSSSIGVTLQKEELRTSLQQMRHSMRKGHGAVSGGPASLAPSRARSPARLR